MDDDDGQPLDHYRQHKGCGVLLICLSCQTDTRLDLERTIARLERTGRGGAMTGIRALGPMTTRACARCGGQRFESRPAFPPNGA